MLVWHTFAPNIQFSQGGRFKLSRRTQAGVEIHALGRLTPDGHYEHVKSGPDKNALKLLAEELEYLD